MIDQFYDLEKQDNSMEFKTNIQSTNKTGGINDMLSDYDSEEIEEKQRQQRRIEERLARDGVKIKQTQSKIKFKLDERNKSKDKKNYKREKDLLTLDQLEMMQHSNTLD